MKSGGAVEWGRGSLRIGANTRRGGLDRPRGTTRKGPPGEGLGRQTAREGRSDNSEPGLREMYYSWPPVCEMAGDSRTGAALVETWAGAAFHNSAIARFPGGATRNRGITQSRLLFAAREVAPHFGRGFDHGDGFLFSLLLEVCDFLKAIIASTVCSRKRTHCYAFY